MIEYKIGDLFDCVDWKTSTIKLIPHCCNNIGRFGSGFAGAVAKRHPHVQQRYFDWFQEQVDFASGKPFALGEFQSVQLDPAFGRSFIVNMIGQNGVVGPDNRKPVKYGYLQRCVEDIGKMVQHFNGHNKVSQDVEICTVKFGAGLAGGEWPIIEEFLLDSWVSRGIKVTIFDLV